MPLDFALGARVVFVRDEDYFDWCIVPKGTLAIVEEVHEDMVWIRVDGPVNGDLPSDRCLLWDPVEMGDDPPFRTA